MTETLTKPKAPHSRVKPPGRFQRVVYGATRRFEGHTMALGLAATAIGIFLAYLAFVSINGVPFQDRYELKALVPSDSPILQEGDTVRIAGRLAGLITGVEPGEEQGATEISMELRPQYAPVGRDAEAKVRVKSLVYLTYLELSPGNVDDPMPEGSTIPVERGGSNVDLLEVVELFDRESRETLSKAIHDTGIGLADRGGELNAALQDLRVVTQQGTTQLEALTRERGALARGIRGASRTFGGLKGARADDVAGLVSSGAEVLATIAGRRVELGETLEELRPFEDEFLRTAPLLDPVLDDAAGLARNLDPVLADLANALPDLNRALALGDEIREETARLTGFLRPVLRAAIPVLAELETTVHAIDALVGPLDTLVETVEPFAADITGASENLISATSTAYEWGGSAFDNPALRFAPIFGCHTGRNPDPEPGEPLDQRQPC